jgi:hypothetical protein
MNIHSQHRSPCAEDKWHTLAVHQRPLAPISSHSDWHHAVVSYRDPHRLESRQLRERPTVTRFDLDLIQIMLSSGVVIIVCCTVR